MISKELLNMLACPACSERPAVRLSKDEQWLICDQCGRHYPIREDIPVMLVEEASQPESGKTKLGNGTAAT